LQNNFPIEFTYSTKLIVVINLLPLELYRLF